MRRRASEKDHQAELRTKVPDEAFDQVERMAAAEGVSMYVMTRELISWALSNYPSRSDGTGTQNSAPSPNFGIRA